MNKNFCDCPQSIIKLIQDKQLSCLTRPYAKKEVNAGGTLNKFIQHVKVYCKECKQYKEVKLYLSHLPCGVKSECPPPKKTTGTIIDTNERPAKKRHVHINRQYFSYFLRNRLRLHFRKRAKRADTDKNNSFVLESDSGGDNAGDSGGYTGVDQMTSFGGNPTPSVTTPRYRADTDKKETQKRDTRSDALDDRVMQKRRLSTNNVSQSADLKSPVQSLRKDPGKSIRFVNGDDIFNDSDDELTSVRGSPKWRSNEDDCGGGFGDDYEDDLFNDPVNDPVNVSTSLRGSPTPSVTTPRYRADTDKKETQKRDRRSNASDDRVVQKRRISTYNVSQFADLYSEAQLLRKYPGKNNSIGCSPTPSVTTPQPEGIIATLTKYIDIKMNEVNQKIDGFGQKFDDVFERLVKLEKR